MTHSLPNLESMIVIPARMHSTRLPKKMLLSETGKPLIQHTYEAASSARFSQRTVVATDHLDIVRAVELFGGNVELTDPDAPSGTDRVAEVADRYPDVDIIVNVQGDEPEISGSAIDLVIKLLSEDSTAMMATLATPIHDRNQVEDPSCVKVVFDNKQNAMYFSRSPIPFPRDGFERWENAEKPGGICGNYFQHIGIYGYRREFLGKFSQLGISSLEEIENLEQLRVLQCGYRIKIATIAEPTIGIDTVADYQAFVKRCRC
ncbi:MAG: 3-deoxy-manno-octulosonate cytidylyltransferase [Pirellulaceae bacterium]|nr:3-deoxy-manno-octulosonate cytidylyltransferase [Pirellulaceae bacterium]